MDFYNERYTVRNIKGHNCELPEDDEVVGLYISHGFFVNLRRMFRKFVMVSPTNPESKRTLKSTAQIEMEEARHLKHHYYMIHPFSDGRVFWETVMIVVYLGLYILMPIEFTTPVIVMPILILKFILDMFSLIDIFLYFFTGHFDNDSQKVEMTQRKIIKRYVLTYFLFDVISSVPYNMIIKISERYDLFRIKYFFVFKLIRLPTLFKYIGKFWERMGYHNYYLSTINIVMLNIIVIWWATAMIFVMFTISIEWDYTFMSKHPWRVAENILDSCYQAIRIFLLVGSNAHFTDDPIDKVVNNCFLLLGCVLNICILANIMQIYIRHSRAKSTYNNLMQQISEYMKYKEMPHYLRNKILQYVDFRFQKQIINEADILNTLSTILKKDILMHNCKRMIQKVQFFQSLPIAVILRMLVKLRSEIYLENDVIIQSGSTGSSMYFIYTGTVAVYTSTGVEVCHLEDGSHFGEMSLIVNDARVATIVAIKNCEVYRLNKRDYQEVMEPYPDLRDNIRIAALEKFNETINVMDKFDPDN